MDTSLIEILVLAVVAGLVLARLYSVLGRRTGAERPNRSQPQPQPAQGPLPRMNDDQRQQANLSGLPSSGDGLVDISRVDPNFDPDHFLQGARGAYEIIIGAYSKGDRDALKSLLTPRVYSTYVTAIEAREASGDKGPELVRLKHAEISDAALEGDIARVAVKFEAELAEGLHHLRETKERWTFERNVRSHDPNWQLGRVVQA
ncbi:MAG: Tim44/TimA family putative adaptor protein [Caulobacterales bacterium]